LNLRQLARVDFYDPVVVPGVTYRHRPRLAWRLKSWRKLLGPYYVLGALNFVTLWSIAIYLLW
jgi:hypothetical protein